MLRLSQSDSSLVCHGASRTPEAGAGCSHGLAGTDNTIFRVNQDGTPTTVADLSAFIKANPVANPDADDFEPDGTWFGMVAVRGALYATEPNHQEIDRITVDGEITRLNDLSTLFVPPGNWQGPTGIAGFLPTGRLGVVNLCGIPDGLNAQELERYLRKDGAETRGFRGAQNT